MKNLLISLFAVFVGIAMNIPDAEAKRFGGGRSFGMQRDKSRFSKPATPPSTQNSGAPNRAAGGTPPKRSWMAPLAGLAAGLGIAALLSHLGLGEEFASMLMLALLVLGGFMLLRFVLRRAGAAPAGGDQQMGYAGPAQPDIRRQADHPGMPAASSAVPVAAAASAGGSEEAFDAAAFERQAKLSFIRLQAAADKHDFDDIRAFTTPEVFAEIAMQLRESGDSDSRTDVIELDCEVLDVAEEASSYVVSVRFSGTLREQRDAAPEAVSEIWHLVKPRDGSEGWRVAGIQQA